MGAMFPWAHLEWAHSLPRVSSFLPLSPLLSRAVERSTAMSASDLCVFRAERLELWRERERVTSQAWAQELATLPCHVRSVLGPDKNIRLLAEIASAMEWPDAALAEDLQHGFPLLGQLSRSGTSPAVLYTPGHGSEET